MIDIVKVLSNRNSTTDVRLEMNYLFEPAQMQSEVRTNHERYKIETDIRYVTLFKYSFNVFKLVVVISIPKNSFQYRYAK